MATIEQVDPGSPVARTLLEATTDELRSLYGPDVIGRTPPATPDDLVAFLVLREDGRAVAGGALKALSADVAEIKRMYVEPAARRRGHARRLLAALEAAASAGGWARVRLDTGARQPEARALYESAGYRSIPDYNANPYASFWAEKDLPAIIPPRFNGPPDSGHGGYSAWIASRYLDGFSEVTLRRPPPLGVELPVTRQGETVRLGDVLEARPGRVSVAPPAAVSVERARAARDPARWAPAVHAFPTCFGCGPLREDGLRLFAGALGDGRHAIDWTPAAAVSPGVVWAALDCPSSAPAANRGGDPPVVLARFAVEIHAPPDASPHVIVSELVRSDGRKRTASCALYDADGGLRAVAQALWIELRPGG